MMPKTLGWRTADLIPLVNNMYLLFVRLSWLALAWSVLAWPCQGFAAPRQVVVLLSDSAAPYQEAARAIREGLENEMGAGRLTLRTVVADEAGAEQILAPPDALLIPLGAKAAQIMLRLDQPMLAGLLARQSYEKLLLSENARAQRRQLSAIYLDQPLSRHFQLVRAIQPRAHSVGVLLGPSQLPEQSALSSAASASGLRLISATLNSDADLFPALQSLLPNVDVLLLLPDPLVVNRNSVQNLMLTTYRQRVPVLGYSPNLVEAGALAAVFSTPQQIGQQIAETIQRMLPAKSWELPPPAYPKYFTIKANPSVARSLDIAVPDEATLLQRMGMRTGL